MNPFKWQILQHSLVAYISPKIPAHAKKYSIEWIEPNSWRKKRFEATKALSKNKETLLFFSVFSFSSLKVFAIYGNQFETIFHLICSHVFRSYLISLNNKTPLICCLAGGFSANSSFWIGLTYKGSKFVTCVILFVPT